MFFGLNDYKAGAQRVYLKAGVFIQLYIFFLVL